MATAFWGWDLGGAHLKLAMLAPDGRLLGTRLWATPLWRGLECLDTAIAEALSDYPGAGIEHGFTLTGELADCFADRRQGVQVLLQRWQTAIGQGGWVYAAGRELIPAERALPEPLALASRNWCATASLCASFGVNGYVIDMGSTTTDIIRVQAGKVLARAEDDGGRLQSGELVYTGIVRTAVGTLCDRAPWQGRWQGLAQETFATTADVYRLLGELDEGVDRYPAADGGEKTPAASAVRLARMLGRDAAEAPLEAWQGLADYFARCQRRRLLDALMLSRSARPDINGSVVVAAGIGYRQVKRLAAAWGLPALDLGAVCQLPSEAWPQLAQIGPAYAVARLLCTQVSRSSGVA